jgi:hypothetical protein
MPKAFPPNSPIAERLAVRRISKDAGARKGSEGPSLKPLFWEEKAAAGWECAESRRDL